MAVGGAWGLYEGLSTLPVGESNRLKLNTVINCCTRRGPFLANNLAVVGVCTIVGSLFYVYYRTDIFDNQPHIV